MSQEERHGTRDRSYSAWHRRRSTGRFVGIEKAQTLAMIDLDASLYVEYDDGTKEPLALIETAVDVGQRWKAATVTQKLAKRANLPAYVVLYSLSALPNPADPCWQDIEQFRIRRLYPNPEDALHIISPEGWANALVELRAWSARRLDRDLFPERVLA